ncbi:MAG: hypothetical protein II942_02235 [Alphaproteobacteria bacterium]|nr:hypothetical protein [Alphaproteobacteria bacterium]
MQLKTLILSAVLGAFVPYVARADVGSISLRMNDEGRIIDIVTSASVISVADASVTNTNTDAGNSSDSVLSSDITPAGEGEFNVEQACSLVGGQLVTYNSTTYCCDSSGRALTTNSQWSAHPLIPQCGCTSSYRKSFQTNSSGDYVCCNGYNMVSSNITGEGVDSVASELCRCPTTFILNDKTVKVRDITAEDSTDLICCARDHKIQSDDNSILWAACSCETGMGFNDNDECEKQCSATYPTLCNNETDCAEYGFWCGESATKHCVAKQTCGDGRAQNETTCECDNECSASDPTGCSTPETCSGVGGSWCPFGGCKTHMSDCTCSDGGTLNAEKGVCCKDGWRAVYGSNGYDELSVADCGCPKYNSTAVTPNAGGVCCYNGNKYNETTKAYDTKSAECCVGEHVEWNETTQTCSCKNGFVTQPDGSCGCPSGMIWKNDKCLYCTTSEDCTSATAPYCKTDANDNLGKCVACLNSTHCSNDCSADTSAPVNKSGLVCDTSFYGGTYTCKSCADIDSTKPWRGRALSDPSACNSCYECIDHSDCADKENKVCLQGKCVNCIHHNTTTGGTPDYGCPDGKICISSSDGKNQCAGCLKDSDCTDSEGDPDSQLECNLSTHECQQKCGSAGVNPETGECVCTGDTPVFNPNTKKCVRCYDSIAEDWTDLGCGDNKTDSAYDPTETSSTPICVESANNGAGKCVRCTKDKHCSTGQMCRSDNTCGCKDGTVWYSLANRCVSCTVNYGVDPAGGRACPPETPTCSTKTYECQCSNNYDGTSGVGVCQSDKPVCDSTNKTCRVCGSAKPYYRLEDKKCVTCGEHATWDSSKRQCKCSKGYAVLKGKEKQGCVAANIPTVRACGDLTRTETQNCVTLELFSFTTVKGMLYQLKFAGTTTIDDQLQLSCDNKIISEGTTDAGSFSKTKNWCRNKSSSGSIECTKADSTQVTSKDNIYIHGDGGVCHLYIMNVTGNCATNACTSGPGASISVTAATTTFDYLAN